MNKGHDVLTLTDGLDMLTALLLVVGRGKFSSLGGGNSVVGQTSGDRIQRESVHREWIVMIEGFRDAIKRHGPSFNQRQYD
jgi:hypothetical protein